MFSAAQYALLKSELQNDPAALGYAAKIAAADYAATAALLASINTSWTCTQPQISLTLLLQWYASGPAQKIVDYANNTSNNAALRAVCLAAQQMFSGAMPYFDYSNPKNQAFVSNLVSGGVLSAADQTNLAALQTLSGVSRTETVLNVPGATATDYDVRIALGV